MNFIVTLTNPQSSYHPMSGTHANDMPIAKTIEATDFYNEAGLLYFMQGKETIAAFPMTRVLSVERQKAAK